MRIVNVDIVSSVVVVVAGDSSVVVSTMVSDILLTDASARFCTVVFNICDLSVVDVAVIVVIVDVGNDGDDDDDDDGE